jgi:hypothetical protein
MKNQPVAVPELSCTTSKTDLARLVTLLQSGFTRTTKNGTTFMSFLSSLPGFTEDYIANDIGTLFLNGDSIDDFSLPLTGKSVTIALSSAMPGLCGTILKKGSPHAALRTKAVVKLEGKPGESVDVRIKLFNVIALERGPELFAHGVQIRTADLVSFLALRPSLLEAFGNIYLTGKALSNGLLLGSLAPHPEILIKAINDTN